MKTLAAALTAALVLAPTAGAQPRVTPSMICAAVDQHPTMGGVLGVTLDLAEATGIPDEQAGRVVASAILGSCPEYAAILQQIVDRYPARGAVA